MCILSGKPTLVNFSFASLLNKGQLIKVRICSPGSKFFSLRVDPIFERLETGNHIKMLPLVKMAAKQSIPIHVNSFSILRYVFGVKEILTYLHVYTLVIMI